MQGRRCAARPSIQNASLYPAGGASPPLRGMFTLHQIADTMNGVPTVILEYIDSTRQRPFLFAVPLSSPAIPIPYSLLPIA